MSTISKKECLNLLFELRDKGIDCDDIITQTLSTIDPPLSVIKFINDHRELNIRKFYEKLRKSYNNKSSKLYINIVKEDKLEPEEIATCLGALLQQILLFNKDLKSTSFLESSRSVEISKCLLHYLKTQDTIPCRKILALVKADLKTLEEISKK